MLGWEFPPFLSGGLGTACHGLAKAMSEQDVDITFMLPRAFGGADVTPDALAPAAQPAGSTVMPAPADPYQPVGAQTPAPHRTAASDPPAGHADPVLAAEPHEVMPGLHVYGAGLSDGYGEGLLANIRKYAERCAALARRTDFDLIHVHDWITYPAGLAVAKLTGKPLLVHVHSTIFDRSGERFDPTIFEIERTGMHRADRVLCVSERTRRTVIHRHGVPAEKTAVVHNGIEWDGRYQAPPPVATDDGRDRLVLFLGRLTMQKGPDFFLEAARQVLETTDRVKFVFAGKGDLAPELIEKVAEHGLGGRVLFTGFLRGEEVNRAFQSADIYVMPSVSEPFGLTALEAVRHGVPVILSRTAGVAEVLSASAMKVDHWDTRSIAERIIALLTRPGLAETMRQFGPGELRDVTWDRAARQCIELYRGELAALWRGVPN